MSRLRRHARVSADAVICSEELEAVREMDSPDMSKRLAVG